VFESYAVMVTAMSAPIALPDQFDFGSNKQERHDQQVSLC
jgi:hypothetical protein